MILAIDVGSTFTDFVLSKDGQVVTHKLLSNSTDPITPFLQGIADLGLESAITAGDLQITHNGSQTINTALLTRGIKVLPASTTPFVAARLLSSTLNQANLIILDMGGASTSIGLIQTDSNPSMVDTRICAIGGNSIGLLDNDGALQVVSPTTNTMPACFGLGGFEPTVTDANLILGRLRPGLILGGHVRLDVSAARMAMSSLAHRLQMRLEDIAQQIIDIANAKLATDIRLLSTTHDIDVSQFKLCGVGGSGALHVCALADALDMKQSIISKFNGVFSAVDLLIAQPETNFVFQAQANISKRASHERIQLHGIQLPVTVWPRDELSPDNFVTGPAIIIDANSSSWIQSGWMAYVDTFGSLLLRRMAI